MLFCSDWALFREQGGEYRSWYRVRRGPADKWQVVWAASGEAHTTCATRGEALRRADEMAYEAWQEDNLPDGSFGYDPEAEEGPDEYLVRATLRDD